MDSKAVEKVPSWRFEIAARFFESAPWGQARNDTETCLLSLRAAQRRSNLSFFNNPTVPRIRDYPGVSYYAFEGKICHPTDSIRHNNIVSGFIAPMPMLRPQILQLDDGDVRIDVTEIDGTTVSGDTKPVHAGDRAVIAIK